MGYVAYGKTDTVARPLAPVHSPTPAAPPDAGHAPRVLLVRPSSPEYGGAREDRSPPPAEPGVGALVSSAVPEPTITRTKDGIVSVTPRSPRGPRTTARPVLTALAVLLLAGPAAAQEGTTTGSIVGRVLGPGGDAAAAATVRVVSVERGWARRTHTDEQGRYVVALLRPGRYRVWAERPPLRPAAPRVVTVRLGERTTVPLGLQPVEGEALEVQARGRRSDLERGGAVDLVDDRQLRNLPTPGRDFTDFVELSSLVSPQPGLGRDGGQFSIGGARTSMTILQIDGVDANNAFFGENQGSRRIPFSQSLESIREFQVIASGYDVEYGRYAGGVINAVTRGGTNDLEGEAFVFARHEALTADGFDEAPPTDFQAYQFGGRLSGPIVADRLHFFVSADFQERDQPAFALTPERSNLSPATIGELQDVLVEEYGFERSVIEGQFGVFEETGDLANLFGRVDWQVGEGQRLTVRANYSDFEVLNDLVDPGGTDALTSAGTFNAEMASAVAELSSVLGRDVNNTLRVQFSEERRPRPGNSDLPTVQIDVADRDGGLTTIEYGGQVFGTLFATDLEERKVQLTDNLAVRLGDHTLKLGTDNLFTHSRNSFWLFGNGFFTFSSIEEFREGDPSSYLRLTPSLTDPAPPSTAFDVTEWSVYLQDDWQVNDRLLVSGGLRYDLTAYERGVPLADPGFRALLEEGFGRNTSTVPEDRDNVGPRLSFSWDLAGDGSETLRGGGGVFYGRVPSVLHANVLLKLPNPLLASVCLGSATPDFDLRAFRDRTAIPSRCRFDGPGSVEGEPGLGITGAPQVTVWDSRIELPTTWKANLGYERRLGEMWRGRLRAVFSRTRHNYTVRDLNLRDEVFRTAAGRPVHVPEEGYDPTVAAGTAARAVDPTFDRLFLETDDGEARSWNFEVGLDGRPAEGLRVSGGYNLSIASDNSSFFCCIESFGLFGTPTAGEPNDLGDPGDEERGAWGPSDFERRHTLVANGVWELPAGVRVGAVYRLQSGNPFTPAVDGDLNGDGDAANDRPFLPDPADPGGVRFASPENLERYRAILEEEQCLRREAGGIVSRNACRDPTWHSLDLKLGKGVPTVGGQRLEVVLDLFNVLDGLGLDAGEFVTREPRLFRAEGFDPASDEVIVSVNESFGRETPVGFEPFQFRAQLGVRYSF